MPQSQHARNSRGHSDAFVVILGALAIVIGSSAIGIGVNRFSPRGIPLLTEPAIGEDRAPATSPVRQELAPGRTRLSPSVPLPKGLETITIAEARITLDKNLALFLDARPPDQYAEGHIPGALNLPAEEFDDNFPGIADKIEANPFIIIYCDGAECSDSIHVAERLIEYGFLGTRVLVDGMRSWVEAGNPVTKGAQP